MQLIVINELQIYLRWQKSGHKLVKHFAHPPSSTLNQAVNMMLLQIMSTLQIAIKKLIQIVCIHSTVNLFANIVL